jgi:N-acetylmuramic acid 6-phosphate (MurNAc-6-P) etherase
LFGWFVYSCERIYREFCPNDSREAAHAQLVAAGGLLKLALVMRARGESRDEAAATLARHGGSLRAAIG